MKFKGKAVRSVGGEEWLGENFTPVEGVDTTPTRVKIELSNGFTVIGMVPAHLARGLFRDPADLAVLQEFTPTQEVVVVLPPARIVRTIEEAV